MAGADAARRGSRTHPRPAAERLRPLAARLIAPAPLRGREVTVAAVALALLGAMAFAPHVRSGGFYSDDWATATVYTFSPEPRYANAVDVQQAILGGRPLLARLQPAPFALFGMRPELHIGLAVAIAVLVAIAFYVLLRAVGAAPLHAAAIAGLALVFPWADSTKLWPIGGVNQVAALLCLAGALLALRGLAARPRAPAAAWHAGAMVLYAAAILTYEAVAGVVLGAGLLYLARSRSWRETWPRWLSDMGLVVAAVAWSRERTEGVRPTASAGELLDDVPEFAGQAVELAGRAITPFDVPLALPLILGALAVAAAIRRRVRAGAVGGAPGAGGDLRWWVGFAVAAALFAAAAWAPFLGSTLHPLDEGLNNRVNMVAALPLAALVYALAAMVAIGLTGRGPAGSLRTAGVMVAIVAAVGAGYGYRVRGDIVLWDRAARLQERMLADVLAATPPPRAGTTLYVWGYPAVVSPGISIFSAPWDLRGALALAWRQPALTAYPVTTGAALTCTRTGIVPVAGPGVGGVFASGYGPAQGARYGRAVFVDAPARRAARIDSLAACRREVARARLAPMVGERPVT